MVSIPIMQFLLLSFCWMMPFLIVSASVKKFTYMCGAENYIGDIVKHVEKSLMIYSNIRYGFGFFFCLSLISVFDHIFFSFLPCQNYSVWSHLHGLVLHKF